ncbi:MAG: MoaD family protein [Desulfurococcales archaeon]|nr:MoaD family protein [Desulfurococcales archaeon]
MEAISVKLRVYATLIEAVGRRVMDVSMPRGSRVIDLLFRTGLAGVVLEDGRVREMYKVLVNGRDIEFLDGLETVLKDGDVVDVFPPVAGG